MREALREAVLRGMGLGVVSEAEFIADPRICTIRIEGDPLYTETYLYCLAERRSSRLISSFFDVVLPQCVTNSNSSSSFLSRKC